MVWGKSALAYPFGSLHSTNFFSFAGLTLQAYNGITSYSSYTLSDIDRLIVAKLYLIKTSHILNPAQLKSLSIDA